MFEVTIKEPSAGNKISIEINIPKGYALWGQDHDRIGNRFVLAFCALAPGKEASTMQLEYEITPTGTGEEHSLTAVVILDTNVVAQDRKHTRTGQVKK